MHYQKVCHQNLGRYEALFHKCFPKAKHLTADYLTWLYFQNPIGEIEGYDALLGERVVAHYVCVPVEYVFDGKIRMGLLSLNTATDPEFQGKGLFVKLASLTYEAASILGYDFVFGIANQNSTHGFTKKLGFELITPLEVFFFLPQLMESEASQNYKLKRSWSYEVFRWRLNNPCKKYYKNNKKIVTGSSISGIAIYSNNHNENIENLEKVKIQHKQLGLFIGCSNFTSIKLMMPNSLKPSPLNFIYKNLGNDYFKINKREIILDFLDFDAY